MKKILILSLILSLLFIVGTASAVTWTPIGDGDLYNYYSIFNISNTTTSELWVGSNMITVGDNISWNQTLADSLYIVQSNESILNVNHSNSTDYWLGYNVVTDLNYRILSYWPNITGRPTVLSNFTDDLGDRGYTSLSNFTNDINLINETFANNTYILQADESTLDVNSAVNWGTYASAGDLNYRILSYWSNITGRPTILSNFTNDQGFINETFGNSTYILQSSESILDVNNSAYWDNETSQANLNVNSSVNWGVYASASDLNYRILVYWANVTGRPTVLSNFTNDQGFVSSTLINATYLKLSGGNLTDDLKITGNTTATVDFCITGGNCLSDAGVGSGDITEVNTPGDYLYGGSTSGAVNLYFNETVLNSSIDAKGATDTNESVRFDRLVAHDCPTGNYSWGLFTNGSLKCNDSGLGAGSQAAVDSISDADSNITVHGGATGFINFTVNGTQELHLRNTGLFPSGDAVNDLGGSSLKWNNGYIWNLISGNLITANNIDANNYRRTSDSNTKFYFQAADEANIQAGGLDFLSAIEAAAQDILVINENNANINFRIDGDTNDNILVVNATTERVGVNISTPTVAFEVGGDIKADELDVTTGARIVLNSSANMCILQNGTDIIIANNLSGITC